MLMEQKNSEWWTRYRQYLKSDEWQWVRNECIRRDKKCCSCGKSYEKGFEVHHMTYRHVGEGDINELESVCLLCRACHFQAHNPGGETYIQMIERRLREMLE